MGGIRRRLDKLKEKSGYQRTTLVCPECGKQFDTSGDVALEYLIYQWVSESGVESHRETPEDILRIFDHEHDPSAFVEKTSGLPFLSREVSGFNLSEPPRGIEDGT